MPRVEDDHAAATRREQSLLPLSILAVGVVFLLVGSVRAAVALISSGSAEEPFFDFVLIGVAGGTLVAAAVWIPRSEIERRDHPRVVAWLFGGVAVMYGFIVLRDLHPGVSVGWALGTQVIALTIGSVGGLLIGISEARARGEHRELEKRTRKLTERERELERQNEQLERFAGIVSHDLRSPLSVAEGRLELARAECDSDHLEHVGRAHDRMDDLIEDLLALARSGDDVGELVAVDVDDTAEECWRTVATGAASLRVETGRSILADDSRFRQLFENLARNAIEHGGEGVTLTVGALDGGLYVEDDGPGIPEHMRDEVFESGYSTDDDGTGFGLAIVVGIVEAHGWEITATEGTDGGARFEITGIEFADGE